MKTITALALTLLLSKTVLAAPYNPTPVMDGLSVVLLQSEMNELANELTSKSVVGLEIAPVKFNWNAMIDDAIAYRASHGGCSADCYAMSQIKIPTAPDVYVPLFFKIKSLAFEFTADGKIFVNTTIGVNINSEIASVSLHFETAGQLSPYSTLELDAHAKEGKPVGTGEFTSAAIRFCPDPIATHIDVTSLNLSYSNTTLKSVVKDKLKEELDRIIANKQANCHTLTKEISPPRPIYGRGIRVAYPTIAVSQGLLEVRTRLIDYGSIPSTILGPLLAQ
jgi:hypothetical protein